MELSCYPSGRPLLFYFFLIFYFFYYLICTLQFVQLDFYLKTYHDARNCNESMIQPKPAIEPLLRLLPHHFSKDTIVERLSESSRTTQTTRERAFRTGILTSPTILKFRMFSR